MKNQLTVKMIKEAHKRCRADKVKKRKINMLSDYRTYLLSAGVNRDQFDECMTWALGEGWRSLPISNSNRSWNVRHGDIFTISGSDNFSEGVFNIGKAFLARNK